MAHLHMVHLAFLVFHSTDKVQVRTVSLNDEPSPTDSQSPHFSFKHQDFKVLAWEDDDNVTVDMLTI